VSLSVLYARRVIVDVYDPQRQVAGRHAVSTSSCSSSSSSRENNSISCCISNCKVVVIVVVMAVFITALRVLSRKFAKDVVTCERVLP